MKFRYDKNTEELMVTSSTRIEYFQMGIWLNRKIKGWKWHPAVKAGAWNGEKPYFKNGRVNLGLWRECLKGCQEINASFILENKEDFPVNRDVTIEKVQEFCNEFFKYHQSKNKNGEWAPFTPHEHQIDAAYKILKNRYCLAEVATSGGKTLIIAIVYFYTIRNIDPNAKLLIIVPSISLVTQFYDAIIDFNIGLNKEFDGGNPNPIDLRIEEIMSDKPRKHGSVSPNICIGTYQSLEKWPNTFFQQFHTIAVDECLHPDTLIRLSNDDLIKVSEIKVGDIVKTINEENGNIENKEVEKIHKNLSVSNQMYNIVLENNTNIKITGNHKVMTIGNIWKRVDELNTEDEIIDFGLNI